MKKLAGPLAALVFGFCFQTSFQASAQPVNDDCTNAFALTLDVVYTLNTTNASSAGDPTNICGSPVEKEVWFEVVPPRNGKLTISTCGSDYDTVLEVYTGSCGALNQVVCADDTGPVCDSDQASVSFLVGVGVRYLIVVGGYNGASGNLNIQATMDPPPNDQCSGAIPLTVGVPYAMSTASATSTNDPVPACAGLGQGVWFQSTATTNGPVTVSTYGSDLYTGVGVYTGNCSALTNIDCDGRDGPGPDGARATARFQGTNGTTYFIVVGGTYGDLKSGNIQVLVEEGAPENDLCSGAIPMVSGITYTQKTTSATSTGDPIPTCGPSYLYNFGSGVWYKLTAPSNGIATISTCGSDFDTLLQIYTGSCGAWTPITDGCSFDSESNCDSNRASTTFETSEGVTYWILAGGTYGAAGNLNIQASLSAALPNDRSTNATPMTEGVVYTENTALATSAGDPFFGCNGNAAKGVWYSFTPANDGVVTISTCGSDYDTAVAVYVTNCLYCRLPFDGCNSANGPACPGNRASVDFLGTAGEPYLIYVGGNNGAWGNLSIEASVQPPLPNDQRTNAIELTNDIPFTMNTATATSSGDADYSCLYNDPKGVWFSFTPLITDDVIIRTVGSDYTPDLGVFAGTNGQMTNVACGSSMVLFNGKAGQKYLIQAGGSSPNREMTGNLKIMATGVPPSNDQWWGAILMSAGLLYGTNTTYATETNDPIPSCDLTASHGVWYHYNPPTDAQITVETCDSDFETVLQVFSGDVPPLTPVGCNNGFGSACATNRASVSFFGHVGTNYYIFAAGKNGAFGNLRISANGPPPGNDTCDAAIDMIQDVVYTNNTTYASSAGDISPVTKGVWYRITPSRDGLLRLSTCGSDFQTVFNVYTGTCNALTYFNNANTDEFGNCPNDHRASTQFTVSADTTYYIDIGGHLGASGNFSIIATMPPPGNDTCAGAIALPNGYLYRMNTLNATEAGDPTPLCQTNFGKGVWFTFTPSVSGTVSISTCNGDLDTVLQVYTGGCDALTPVANTCNDDNGPDCNSFSASVHFAGQAGVTYWILVGGYGGAGGNLAIEANVLPVLGMQQAGTNAVLYWPYSLSGYYPEFTTNLTPPVFWTNVPYLIGGSDEDDNYFTTSSIPITPGKPIFYRLKK
jgi:hypothetical protein